MEQIIEQELLETKTKTITTLTKSAIAVTITTGSMLHVGNSPSSARIDCEQQQQQGQAFGAFDMVDISDHHPPAVEASDTIDGDKITKFRWYVELAEEDVPMSSYFFQGEPDYGVIGEELDHLTFPPWFQRVQEQLNIRGLEIDDFRLQKSDLGYDILCKLPPLDAEKPDNDKGSVAIDSSDDESYGCIVYKQRTRMAGKTITPDVEASDTINNEPDN